MINKLILLFCITLLFNSCGNYNTELYNASTLMVEDPDSALKILSSIDRDRLCSRSNRAKYSLLYTQALDKNWIDTDNDSLISYAVDYYKIHGRDIDKAKAYYYYGIVRNNAADIKGAMESSVKARIYAEKTNDNYLIGLIYNVIGNLYYDQCSLEEAVVMYSNAATAFSEAGSRKNLLYAIHSKGLTEAYLNRNHEALASLNDAIILADEQADTAAYLDVLSALGAVSAKMSPDSTALQSIKAKLLLAYKRYSQNVIPIEHYPIIGNICYKEQKLDSARLYFAAYLRSKPTITEANCGIFAILSSIEMRSGSHKKAIEYEKLYSFYTDSINNVHKDILIQNLETKYKAEYFRKSYIALQAKNEYEMMIIGLVIVLVIIIIGILAVTLKRAILIRNQKIAEYENYVTEVQQHYMELQAEYYRVSQNIKDEQSQTLLILLKNRIHSLQSVLELASKYENNTDAFYKNFTDRIKVVSDNNKELAKDVIAIANLSCHGIINHLGQLYPTLSQRELCYCGLICLGFTPESIRILYNHTNVYSIYTMRCKIRSKMGLTKNSLSLESNIIKIMENLEPERM